MRRRRRSAVAERLNVTRKTRLAQAVLLILSLLPLLQFTYMGQFSRLILDDYIYLEAGREHGPWGAIVHMRNTWNGAYTDLVAHSVFARFGSAAPRVLIVVLVTCWLLALAWLIKCALRRLNASTQQNALSLGVAALTIAASINALHTAQSFYWYVAAVTYSLPLVAFILFLIFLLATDVATESAPRLVWLATVGLAYCFVAAGTSAMYMVFQATALGVLFVPLALESMRTGLKARLVLIVAGLAGTAASFLVQITAPGIALRVARISPTESVSLRALPDLAQAVAETLFWYAGQEKTFAGVVMLFGVGLFAALLLHRSPYSGSPRGSRELARAPLCFCFAAQLLFVPILWTHTSDQPAVFGRYSYAFFSVIVLNVALMLLLSILLWQRRRLGAWLLENRNGLLILSVGALLLVLVMFAATHFRSIHYRASRYMFATSTLVIGMLCWQLAQGLEDEQSKRYGRWAIVLTSLTAASYVVLLGVSLYSLGKPTARISTPAVFLHVSLGLVCGAYLGYLMRRVCQPTPARETWLRRIGLSGLVVASAISAGIMLGQARLIPNLQTYAREWDERERLIISQRDSGQREVVVAPLSFDLSWNLLYQRMSEPWEAIPAASYYGVESIRVVKEEP